MLFRWIRKYKASSLIGALSLLFLIVTLERTQKVLQVTIRSMVSVKSNERYGHVQRHNDLECTKWAVTVHEEPTPSEGIRRFIYDPSWCLVIVRLSEDPNFKIRSTIGSNIFVLDEYEQKKMRSQFVNELPQTLESRRNVGYLFALAHGAQMIFDFDARSEVKFWMPNALPKTEFVALNHFENPIDFVSLEVKRNGTDCPIYDSYDIQLDFFVKKLFGIYLNCKINNNLIQSGPPPKGTILGILHSRVDSIESTQDPMATYNKKAGSILPKGIYYPFGTEASIFYPSSFWALFVPPGVSKRDGEVLRSFVAKYVCDILNIKMGFTFKSISWIRKKNVKDMEKTLLSLDVQRLIDELSSFNDLGKQKSSYTPQLILDVWYHLYSKNYISMDDLLSIQSWIQTLIHLDIQFPGTGDKSPTLKIENLNSRVGKAFSGIVDSSPKCEVKKSKSFWTSDLHNGVRADFPSLLTQLNQTVWVCGIWKTRNLHGIFTHKGVHFSENLSPTINKIQSQSSPVSEEDIKRNLEHYKKHPINMDAFMCGFPASMCEIWMPLKKKLFFVPAHRYNLGRCTVKDWKRLNSNLKKLDRKQNYIGALSRYDLEYLDHYTNLSPNLLLSYSEGYLGTSKYNPSIDRFPYFDRTKNPVNLDTPEAKRQNIVRIPHYNLPDLLQSKGIVYEAYSVMSYKMTEFYLMGIPLFVPSLSYYGRIGFGEDRTSVSSFYCNVPSLGPAFPADEEASHPFNPNLDKAVDPYAEIYWLQYSDFYDWPHVVYYDNMSHLHYLIDHTDFKRISEKMLIEVEIKKSKTYGTWCEEINKM